MTRHEARYNAIFLNAKRGNKNCMIVRNNTTGDWFPCNYDRKLVPGDYSWFSVIANIGD